MASIVIIGGCGHVGLPLGLAFARVGQRVLAFDRDVERVAATRTGIMPFRDRGASAVLEQTLNAGTFQPTTDARVIADAETVITVIGTPLDEHLNPRPDVYRTLVDDGSISLRSGQLLVLRSTVFPGTTERVAKALRERGLDLDVAFCPERVAEGVALEEIVSLPQIVAGCGERAQARATKLFALLTPNIIPLRPAEAELTKLFNNSWRYIQFAAANQMYMIANDHGVDFYTIHRAMTEDYPRGQGFPKAGFTAGPCLFKDTMQLSRFANNTFFIGHASMLVNEGLPDYLVRCVQKRFTLENRTVGILGMTFKGESDDTRDSLAFRLRKILSLECRAVLCSDPFLSGTWLTPLEQALQESDILFIGAPHRIYRDLDFAGKPVIDVWNVTPSGLRTV